MIHTKEPKRLSRADSFLGFHFDFHATADNQPIGSRPFRADLARMLRKVKPDYVQSDCKGHPGVASYPTKVGTPAPKFAGDALKVWREETARQGVALFMHYSGVWDTAAIRLHPEWARSDEKGKPDPNNTSVFGPYVHELMIPQLIELRRDYGVDGFWVDGDCWAMCAFVWIKSQPPSTSSPAESNFLFPGARASAPCASQKSNFMKLSKFIKSASDSVECLG